MALDKITGSPVLRQGNLEATKNQEIARQNEALETQKTKDAKIGDLRAENTSAVKSSDTAEISATAHRLMALRQAVETGRAALAAMPEIREEKVAQVRERLQAGFYNSPEVQAKTAEGIERTILGIEEL